MGHLYMWPNVPSGSKMLIELARAFAGTGDFQQGIDALDEALADSARAGKRDGAWPSCSV